MIRFYALYRLPARCIRFQYDNASSNILINAFQSPIFGQSCINVMMHRATYWWTKRPHDSGFPWNTIFRSNKAPDFRFREILKPMWQQRSFDWSKGNNGSLGSNQIKFQENNGVCKNLITHLCLVFGIQWKDRSQLSGEKDNEWMAGGRSDNCTVWSGLGQKPR